MDRKYNKIRSVQNRESYFQTHKKNNTISRDIRYFEFPKWAKERQQTVPFCSKLNFTRVILCHTPSV